MDHQATLTEIDNLSMGELQRQLVTWVEEKGLLNELRAYLRKKMIFLLKDTILDQKTSVVDHICVTPKLQALALLVAEYLLSQRLFYSLSVFSTEVPTITHVNKFCQQIQNTDEVTEDCPKLDTNEITHILEAIGLSNHPNIFDKIMTSYTTATDRKVSLIGTIFESISAAVNSLMSKNYEKVSQGTSTDELLSGTKVINSLTDLNLLFEECHLKQYQSAVFLFIEKEQARVKSEEKAKYKSKLFKHQKLLYQEVKIREEYVLKKLNEAEVRLMTQKQQIESNLKRKQNHLQELADELSHIHTQLARREELLNSLKQEAISVLKDKSNDRVCEQCKSCDHLKNLGTTNPPVMNASQEQTSVFKTPQTSDSDRLCERKLFSDIILSLQKENSNLRDQSLKHRTSIMKLKCKLAKKRSVHENKRPLYTSQLCLPRPSSLSPIISSDKEQSSNSSIKSDVTPVNNTASIERISNKTSKEENNKDLQDNSKSGYCLSNVQESVQHSDYVRSFVSDSRTKKKCNAKQNNETKRKVENRKDIETKNSSKLNQKLQKENFESENDNIVEENKGRALIMDNQFMNNLKQSDQQSLNMKNSFHQIEYNEQIKSEIQQTVSVQIQESSKHYEPHTTNTQNEIKPEKYTCIHQDIDKNVLLNKAKAGKIMQIPNVLIDVDTSDMYEGTFKDIAKKMKPLEDCILYSKRVPNIYYAEPTYFESSSQGDSPKNCTRCNSSVLNKEKCKKQNRNENDHKSYLGRNLSGSSSPNSKLSKNIKAKSSDISVISSQNSSSSTHNKKSRKSCAQISNISIENMDENELFKKVCKSLGVPLTPITSEAENEFPSGYFLNRYKSKHVDNITPKRNGIHSGSEKGFENTNSILDNSILSTISDNSRDCETPTSLIINSTSSITP